MIKLILILVIVSNSASYIENHEKFIEQNGDKDISILKCCDPGYAYSFKDLTCVANENPFRLDVIKVKINPMAYFHFHYRKPRCPANQHRVVVREVFDENIALGIDSNGNLHIDTERNANTEIIGSESFCVDNLVLENDTASWTIFNGIVCIEPTTLDYHIINSTCMIISCIFILMTVTVYICLPELNNQHGRVLIAYLVCLFTGYSMLAAMKMLLYFNKSTTTVCFGLNLCDIMERRSEISTFIRKSYLPALVDKAWHNAQFLNWVETGITAMVVYFSLLAAFFWQNVMCFDIWRTFSGRRVLMTNKLTGCDKFYTYLAYAFGIPTILTTILFFVEFYPLPSKSSLPERTEPCFLSGNKRLIYLYSPILVLWVADMMFFILTIKKIWQIKQQTSVLYTGDNATHCRHNIEKQRLFLYIKLFIVMGINWVLEVVSAHAAQDNTIWLYTDAYNALIGCFIFIIFVCKRKRYAQMFDVPVVKSQSSTRTINTSVKITHV